ncbi:3-deoxy-manno-octulosonate cytidylyltransferase [Marichromatium gracile]|uniref:3-deoxy-manno-octulosonate cytidylyltransferase n=1 Tax=Marichromatium TaxID=85076 RepID=UPI000F4159A0|nr:MULTISPECIES: 3-deoxy-manno-octulosonate cytidylyltransferase [Marichromatium]MCF1184937.1 3-deoxy-manno-octulosonate cytidylyltransferase [Marichromatium gracile]RNE91059.1 3-deoxy-manno-octulosonate cytidylyltransferase [Marichromatium sp. AB31]RNE93734.1 3-deoxy-manno-octulosonate cytidylyltransferase [Marichromatium sp. AB32]
MAKGFKVVIPARYGSSRLPGKPLLEIAGEPMIRHVVARACASGADEVVVASDDARILDACAGLGAATQLTATEHRSGTERVAEVIAARGWEADTVVVNLQGDEPCMPAALIDQVASDLAGCAGAGMATLASPIRRVEALFDPHVVKVVTDVEGFALYFSRAPLPWHRDEFLGSRASLPESVTFLRHIGLYAYRAGFLERYLAWPPAPLEVAESLEQLRVLWHGERIHVGIAERTPGPGVDTREDLGRAEAWMSADD